MSYFGSLLGSEQATHSSGESTSAEHTEFQPPAILLEKWKREGGGLNVISPYQNLMESIRKDPTLLQNTKPQYIIPEGSDNRRSFYERMSSKAGFAVGCGYIFGIIRSNPISLANSGFEINTSSMKGFRSSLHTPFSSVLTIGHKHGAVYAQALGTAVTLFAFIDWIMELSGWEKFEEARILTAGAISGAIYRSPTWNNKKIAKGTLLGIGFAAVYALLPVLFLDEYRDKRRAMLGF